jgi:hypothetical protein
MDQPPHTADETPAETTAEMPDPTMLERYAAASRAHAARGDGRLAVLAMWAADVELLHQLLWENGLGDAPDPPAQLAAVGEALLGSLTESSTQSSADPGATPREVLERSRRAMVATFDTSVHAMLEEQLLPADHLDVVPSSTERAGGPALERLEARTPEMLVAELQVTAADCMAVAEVLLLEGDTTGALRQAWQADLASFEAFLVAAAIRAGDDSLATVDLRWDLAVSLRLAPEPVTGAFAATVEGWREALVGVVAGAEVEALRTGFQPLPLP